VCGPIKTFDAAELRGEDQRTLKIVSPAVVGATKVLSRSFLLSHHSCSVMAADVIKSAQNAVGDSDNDDGLAA